MNLSQLSAEFPKPAVHWRVQGKPYERSGKWSAMALAYIDARDVMDRLDEVCGPENWQSEYVETVKGRVICRIGIRIGDAWVWKSDGAGDTAVEGEKGGISDSLKRAAVAWGVGRYLYRLDSPWVGCEVGQKGGNPFWKRWTEDPWSKVKSVGYTQPKEPVEEKADEPVAPASEEFDPAAQRDRLKKGFGMQKTAAALESAKAKNADVLAKLAQVDPPKFAEVTTAFNDRMSELAA